MNTNYLESIDWEKYLERETDFFIFTIFVEAYGALLQEIAGIRFGHQLNYYKRNIGIFYKSKLELTKFEKYFTGIIEENDTLITNWIEKEKEISQEMKTEIYLKKYHTVQEQIYFFKEAIIYNTIIPYWLLISLNSLNSNTNSNSNSSNAHHPERKEKVEQLQQKLEQIRQTSHYPTLLTTIIYHLMDQAAKKINIPVELARYLTSSELIEILEPEIAIEHTTTVEPQTTISAPELTTRKNECYFYYNNEKFYFIYEDFTQLEQKMSVHTQIPLQKTIQGITACKGKVKGKVKIINNPNNMKDFNFGDILVSINLNPSLTPIIDKASAIITNEGGIMCHAAIISRERGIPCIIGTSIATKVFKDGDYIEVNADEGIIHKIDY